MTIIDKIAYIHLVDGKVLCTRSKGKDVYYSPGGKREGNETDLESLVREIKEELSVDIIPETVQKYGVFEAQADGKAADVIVKMTCYTAEFTGNLRANSEIAEIAWLGANDTDKISQAGKLIFNDLQSKGLLS